MMAIPVKPEPSIEYPLSGALGPALSPIHPVSVTHKENVFLRLVAADKHLKSF